MTLIMKNQSASQTELVCINDLEMFTSNLYLKGHIKEDT